MVHVNYNNKLSTTVLLIIITGYTEETEAVWDWSTKVQKEARFKMGGMWRKMVALNRFDS